MTSYHLQSNYSSTVTLRGGPVVLRLVRATPCYISMPLPPDSVDEASRRHCVLRLSCILVYRFVHLSGQILLPRYLMNDLNNCDITDREYLLKSCEHHISWITWAILIMMKFTWNNHITTAVLILKGQGHTLVQVCGGKGIYVDAGALSPASG